MTPILKMFIHEVGPCLINPDEYEPIRIHWMTLYVYSNNTTHFSSFGVK